MITQTHPAVAEYLSRTRAALADLPASEVEEVVEDIGPQLNEIAGELGEDVSVEALTERLGTPEQYAGELRAAAGYPPAKPGGQPPWRRTVLPRIALWGLVLGVPAALLTGIIGTNVGFDGRDFTQLRILFPCFLPLFLGVVLIFNGRVRTSAVDALPESRAAIRATRAVVDALPDNAVTYLRSLRPGWWLVRIAVLVGVSLLVLNVNVTAEAKTLLPVLVLIVLLLFGAKARTDGRWRWVVIPANAFTVGAGLALIGALVGHSPDDQAAGYYYVTPPYGLYNSGSYVENIYVFDADGKPLPEVYLYDQQGRAITVPDRDCEPSDNGLSNRFPLPRVDYSAGCREITGAPFTVAIPRPSTSAPTAPPSSATTSSAATTPPTTK